MGLTLAHTPLWGDMPWDTNGKQPLCTFFFLNLAFPSVGHSSALCTTNDGVFSLISSRRVGNGRFNS